MNAFLLASAVLSLAYGQEVDLNEVSVAPSLMDKAAAVGLAQPTSPANYAIETSQEGVFLEATSANNNEAIETGVTDAEANIPNQVGGVLNVMGGASEGDSHGAAPRQNLVYFGIGRHGFGLGAECDGCVPCCGGDKGGNRQRNGGRGQGHNCEQPQQQQPQRYADPCAEPQHNAQPQQQQPYLKVTPTLKVEAFTRTHVETKTSALYDVHTSYQTRTVTDEIKSTKTEYVHPEQTYTYVEYQTVYEYPAATIDANQVRHPQDPNYQRNGGYAPQQQGCGPNNQQHNNNNNGGCCGSKNGGGCGGCGSCFHCCH